MNTTPSVKLTAFNCPHCGALAKQFWSDLYAYIRSERDPCPSVFSKDWRTEFDLSAEKDPDKKREFIEFAESMASGNPFLRNERLAANRRLHNVSLSECYNCKKVSLWIYDRLVFPNAGDAPPANPDLPDEIRADYEEASSILDRSPRGAAALIRLAIQKLCKILGQPGDNINRDIGALVKGGLDPRVQMALDAVRVIGNNAVHPGHLDLQDDRATAETLFKLLNLIVEKTISEPKHVEAVYSSLPRGALEAIDRRDGNREPD